MSATVDDVSSMLGQSAADWLSGPTAAARPRGELGTVRPVNRALRREMAALGWIGLALPESIGGVGLGLREALVLCEAFGRHAFPEPYVATVVMPEVLLACAGEHPRVRDMVALQTGGDRWLTLAWQERTGDIGLQSPQTRLESLQLTGTKCFVPAVEPDTFLLVSASEAGETVLLAVDAGAPGVVVEPAAAADGVSLASVRFESVVVRPDAVLLRGAAADAALARAVAAGTLASAAHLAGLATACVSKTVDYVNGRRQFERVIGSFQTVQHRLVDLYAANRLAGASWRHALQRFEAASTGAEVETARRAISAAKARCADAAVQAGRVAVQLHGAMGFTEEADIGLYLRAALFHAAWLGNATQHRRRFVAGLTPEALVHV
jgi:alkylation response protein AidB-like acyl-CoA dehydrogenase